MKLYSHYQKSTAPPVATKENWSNHAVTDGLLYSYRTTFYHAGSFPSNLHYHDYYELIVIEQGNIGYICESRIYYPQKGDVILIPPGKFHMSFLNDTTTQYDRHVFYFYPSAFDAFDGACLCQFAQEEEHGILLSPDGEQKERMSELLERLHTTLSAGKALERTLGISFILQFFYLLNQKHERVQKNSHNLPENVLQLKNYIDTHYQTLGSVAEVAKQFYYSREHASRLFKKHFDITVSDYILQRRILESQKMILQGHSITDAALAVGFNSMSAFVRGFREISGTTPSEYRKAKT